MIAASRSLFHLSRLCQGIPRLVETLHAQEYLTLESLQIALYEHLVQDEIPKLIHSLENRYSGNIDIAFFTSLHQHNYGQGWWSPGWTIIAQSDKWQVKQHGLLLEIEPDRHLQNSNVALGAQVAIKMPRNRIEGGSYVAIGNAGLPTGSGLQLLFHCGAAGVAGILGELTQWLNAAGIAFTLAVPQDPNSYPRRDAVRLLLRQQDYCAVRSLLNDDYKQLIQHLQVEVAPLCKPIAPGIGLIEVLHQDGLGDRCRIIAAGILALESSQVSLAAIEQILITNNISPEHPYLNPGAADNYRTL
jgi:HopA1 effector protein family